MTAKTQTKKAASGKTLIVIQTGSMHGKAPGTRETMKGLGLKRIDSRKELADTPQVRGMIARVKHLVRVEEKG